MSDTIKCYVEFKNMDDAQAFLYDIALFNEPTLGIIDSGYLEED